MKWLRALVWVLRANWRAKQEARHIDEEWSIWHDMIEEEDADG